VAIGFGFVLGEVMIRTIGGKWEYDEKSQEWLVAIGDPIGKAYKLLSDDFQSMVSLLRITRLVKEKGGWEKIGTRLGSDEVRDDS
jgi:hypothetical protein